MGISTVAARLDARIQNFRSDAESELLKQHAQTQVATLSTTIDTLTRIAELMQCLAVDQSVQTDDAIGAITTYRDQLREASLTAVQRPAAGELVRAVDDLAERSNSSARKVWRNLFSRLTDDIEKRVNALGWTKADRTAKTSRDKVSRARVSYPVSDREKTEDILGAECAQWRDQIDRLFKKLISDLEAAEEAVGQLPEIGRAHV